MARKTRKESYFSHQKVLIGLLSLVALISIPFYLFVLKPKLIQSQGPIQVITSAKLVDTAIIDSDDRILLQCFTGVCTITSKLFSSDATFECPGQNKVCTATITMSTGHNCTENVPLANLQIDGNTISEPGGITELRLCNPADANGNFDNVSSYTWVQTGITSGTHTANVLITYNSTNATGIGFDHQTLVVNVYSPK